jgi:hypothetical protein
VRSRVCFDPLNLPCGPGTLSYFSRRPKPTVLRMEYSLFLIRTENAMEQIKVHRDAEIRSTALGWVVGDPASSHFAFPTLPPSSCKRHEFWDSHIPASKLRRQQIWTILIRYHSHTYITGRRMPRLPFLRVVLLR